MITEINRTGYPREQYRYDLEIEKANDEEQED